MFSFFKKKKDGDTSVPDWALFFSATEYNAFVSELENYFKGLNVAVELSDGVVIADEKAFGFEKLGLTNVAQVCKQEKIADYKEIIAAHFDAMIRAQQFEVTFNAIADNFEEVRKYIGVRLYDNAYVDMLGKELTLGKDFAGEIYAMIVFDFPDSIVNIQPTQIKAWAKTVEELFQIGVENTKNAYPLTISSVDFGAFNCWFVQGEHFFTPNVVFELENRKELLGSKGALIGIPHRHAALIYSIETIEVIAAINALIPTIYGMNEEGPGSLSNQLFWYKDGVFTELPYSLQEGEMKFTPPANFVELLNELASHN